MFRVKVKIIREKLAVGPIKPAKKSQNFWSWIQLTRVSWVQLTAFSNTSKVQGRRHRSLILKKKSHRFLGVEHIWPDGKKLNKLWASMTSQTLIG